MFAFEYNLHLNKMTEHAQLNKHNRRSFRLKGYDYSTDGLYFLTICCQNRKCMFGNIHDGEMILNDAGLMIEYWYKKLESKFPQIRCHEMMIMPNHFHCVIEIKFVPMKANDTLEAPITINSIVQWFKTMTTNDYIKGVKQRQWVRFKGKLWQRNYWDHIIRNQKSYDLIADYIINNPINWENDILRNGGMK